MYPSDPCLFAPVGDSISMWTGTPNKWTVYAPDAHLVREGGWAGSGAHLDDMAAGVEPYDADVLVLMGGTNDVRDSGGADMTGYLETVADIIEGADVAKVIISAIPPNDPHPAWAAAWNLLLLDFADVNGYTFTDPWADWRTISGTWTASRGMDDGIHPQEQVSRWAGHRLRRTIGLLHSEGFDLPVWYQDPFAWIGVAS